MKELIGHDEFHGLLKLSKDSFENFQKEKINETVKFRCISRKCKLNGFLNYMLENVCSLQTKNCVYRRIDGYKTFDYNV